uniref:Uncharacterized protein n=1 Tax=Arundo donax TaxID=35708 RepID=A0A0A9BZT7_ARUDO
MLLLAAQLCLGGLLCIHNAQYQGQ